MNADDWLGRGAMPYRKWTQAEDEYVIATATHPVAEVADHLGRGYVAVVNRRTKLLDPVKSIRANRDPEIRADYLTGMMVDDIVAKYEVTLPVVYKAIEYGDNERVRRKSNWSPADDAMLRSGLSAPEIGAIIGRTAEAVRTRRYYLRHRKATDDTLRKQSPRTDLHQRRNMAIIAARRGGASVQALADEHGLSPSMIRKILRMRDE